MINIDLLVLHADLNLVDGGQYELPQLSEDHPGHRDYNGISELPLMYVSILCSLEIPLLSLPWQLTH